MSDIESYEDLRELAHDLFDADDNDFRVLRGPAGTVDPKRPLYVLVHPGDMIQRQQDVEHSESPEEIMDYSLACQGGTARELAPLRGWDIVVLHRASTSYSLSWFDDVSHEYIDLIAAHADGGGVLLWGDDLHAAAEWLTGEYAAADRPQVVLGGAWSEDEHGCVTIIGKDLEAAGAVVRLSRSACISPDGSGAEWVPALGRFEPDDQNASPAMGL